MATKKSKTGHPVPDVISALPDAALLLDSTGIVLHVNASFQKLLGIKSKDITGKQLAKTDFLPKEAQQLLKKRLKKLEAGTAVEPLDAGRLRLHYSDTDPAEALVEMAVSRNWRLYELVPERRTLEQIFIELTCSDAPAQPAAEAAT